MNFLLVLEEIEAGRLEFSTDVEKAVAHGLFQFIAVGTPPDEDGSADLSHVLAVAASVGEVLDKPLLVVVKSTVPVGCFTAARKAPSWPAVSRSTIERRSC